MPRALVCTFCSVALLGVFACTSPPSDAAPQSDEPAEKVAESTEPEPFAPKLQPLSECKFHEEVTAGEGPVGVATYECRDKYVTGMVMRRTEGLTIKEAASIGARGMLDGLSVMSPWQSPKFERLEEPFAPMPSEATPFGRVTIEHAKQGEYLGDVAVLVDPQNLHIAICITPKSLYPERCAGMGERLFERSAALAKQIKEAP